ncbi:sensor histidine kinase [Cohnella thailandensis]|uniref:histidine kinase n=1 Tax=Cohnella thailandensis TaxID=557557 RepID=A0A841T7I7_9BACL|nr:sensor histidine kinase [Cohnella thailandensis]MBB6638030.1 sensor histidine kinase [Cohnella thailandensis]MBP1972043.1 two-component system sensor histidine kinase YesM [Cohnella thailandensis]
MTRFQSIHGRLFLIFLFSLLGLLLIVSFVYYQRATEQVRDKVGDVAEKNISQTVGLFDLMLKGYDSVTKSLNSNNELMRLLQTESAGGVEAVNLERRITDILGAIFYSRNDIIGIHVVTNSGRVYSFDLSIGGAMHNYSGQTWFEELKKSTGEMKWLGVYPESLMSTGIDRPVFAFGRQLYELSTLKSVGVVLIETDAEAIVSALRNASLGPGSNVILRESGGKEIIRTQPEEDGMASLPDGWPGPLKVGEVLVREHAGAMVTAARISTADWTVIGVTPNRELNLELKQTQQFLLTVILVLVIAATVLATLVSRSFSSPFKRLIQQMKQVELGNFKGEVRVHSYHELNVLVGSFNRMVRQMDDLIERIKLASISEKNAQLQALQSQVNPHFLFNTLDMIYWMLDERENDRLGKIILSLSRILRFSSDWEEASRTTLRAELEQLEHYLTIIETRLKGRVRTSIEVDERWLGTKVPKLILQPVIENAVKYGLEPLNREGALRVCSRESDGRLEIVIQDDGVGMDEETLRRIRESLKDSPSGERDGQAERRGIGLLNVHHRIRLMFGEAYGLGIESEPDRGTTVVVSFPIERGGNAS